MIFLTQVITAILLVAPGAYAETTNSGGGNGNNGRVNLDVTSYGMARNCRNFIQSDGSLGPWGTELVSSIERVGTDCFYEEADMSLLCPRYSQFERSRKNQFLAFLFASIAFYESSCNTDARAQGTNDVAVGLLQLEDSARQRRNAGRNATFCPHTPVNDTYSVRYQMRCGASTFADGYCKKGLRPGSSSWYWQKLNGNRGIAKMAKKFPFC